MVILLFTFILQHVVESIQGAPFQKMCADVATPLNLGTTSFGPVTDFLQGAGQSQIVSQVYLLTCICILI